MTASRVPVVAVTGYLGAGKTSLLNHLLRTPGARLGVVVNDFGALNVDAALVAGQVDEAASIAGGCLCCLPDAGGLDEALAKLAHPRLRLDAILVEASGAAEPLALARLIRGSRARVRPGGMIDVVDAVEHFSTVDAWPNPPLRYAAATLVVVGKTDLLPAAERDEVIGRVRRRVRERNPHAPLVVVRQGRIDPALVFDVASDADAEAMLPLGEPFVGPSHGHGEHGHGEHGHGGHEHGGHGGHGHGHARAAGVLLAGPVSPTALVDLLESPPEGAYRVKGRVRVCGPKTERGYLVNLVGRTIHVASLPAAPPVGELVAIGPHLDPAVAECALRAVAEAPMGRPDAAGLRRLNRHRRLSN